MNIATWNVERLKHKRSLVQFILTCNEIEADILILTEADSQIKPDYEFSFHPHLSLDMIPLYKSGGEVLC